MKGENEIKTQIASIDKNLYSRYRLLLVPGFFRVFVIEKFYGVGNFVSKIGGWGEFHKCPTT